MPIHKATVQELTALENTHHPSYIKLYMSILQCFCSCSRYELGFFLCMFDSRRVAINSGTLVPQCRAVQWSRGWYLDKLETRFKPASCHKRISGANLAAFYFAPVIDSHWSVPCHSDCSRHPCCAAAAFCWKSRSGAITI